MFNFLIVLSKVKKFVYDVLYVLFIVWFDIFVLLVRVVLFLLLELFCILLLFCFIGMVLKFKCIVVLWVGKKFKDRFVLIIKWNRKYKYKDLGII